MAWTCLFPNTLLVCVAIRDGGVGGSLWNPTREAWADTTSPCPCSRSVHWPSEDPLSHV